MASSMKGRSTRKLKEPKELLMFFPEDYSAVKVSKNKIVGTAQQLSRLKENTWVNVDIGDEKPWKGLIIKTGQTRNELGRCELAFLAFLSQHSSDKENIPLNDFFTQQKDTESDDEEFFHEVETITKENKKKKTPKKVAAKRPRDHDDPAVIQNKNEKKLKREQASAQAMASRKQSFEILKSLDENRIQETDESDDELDAHSNSESEVVVTEVRPTLATQAESKANEKRTKKITEKVQPASDQPIKPISINDATLESGNVVHILQEMFAKSMRGIHERFDSMEKAIQALTEQQKATEKIMTSKVLKSKTSRPLNLVVSHSHSPLGNGSALVSRQPLEFTPERQKQAESRDQQDTPESVEKDETGL
ncbi:uncharacterized protein [Montipora capricornis]|uniref:uncharacterized protein n=1 Tax=Montipora capricornis TaxID=246305 RepID=UPI0035F11356